MSGAFSARQRIGVESKHILGDGTGHSSIARVDWIELTTIIEGGVFQDWLHPVSSDTRTPGQISTLIQCIEANLIHGLPDGLTCDVSVSSVSIGENGRGLPELAIYGLDVSLLGPIRAELVGGCPLSSAVLLKLVLIDRLILDLFGVDDLVHYIKGCVPPLCII